MNEETKNLKDQFRAQIEDGTQSVDVTIATAEGELVALAEVVEILHQSFEALPYPTNMSATLDHCLICFHHAIQEARLHLHLMSLQRNLWRRSFDEVMKDGRTPPKESDTP